MNYSNKIKPQNSPLYLIIFCMLYVASLSTSKAGMNIFSVLLTLSSMYIIITRWSQLSNNFKRVIFVCSSLFSIGLSFSYIANFDTHDSYVFLKKNIYLLIIPSLILYHQTKENRNNSILLFVIATLVSAIYSIANFVVIDNFNLDARSLGFLDYARHINILLMSISCLLVHLSYNCQSASHKFIGFSLLSILFISLIISGTRGGWVGASVILTYFSIIVFRAKSLYFFSALIVIAFSIGSLLPEQSAPIKERFTSIFDLSTNVSNSARLTMWKGGVDFIESAIVDNPKSLLLGSGPYNSDKNYKSFILEKPIDDQMRYMTDGVLYGGSDFHNTYIDLSVKSGVIYGIVLVSFLFYIVFISMINAKNGSTTSRSISLYFVGLLAITPFYSLLQDYSAYTIIFAVSLILGEKLGVEHES